MGKMGMVLLVLVMLCLVVDPAQTGVFVVECSGDDNGDGVVTINELVLAVRHSLEGCPAQPSRFVDNFDGTVTDHQTGLMWEKKEAGGSCLHCANDTYPWRDALSEWLSEANGLVASADFQVGLGGHSDW